ncbi:histidine kinase/DNA gyrase B/HSP90-like ATPase [Chitinophaga skermanii]|uniref:histidine kinase n=1 Tax=Chitinophaga skermanii TaxID=331697 RepID=A0A327QR09_9BACT|nr:histidine kinase [Chitinophaga skermanii]RAJ06760.1 histidine kinase/DNA gyrase B/HSP90-like ATPase [Chitinophaga skermanii]
MNFVEIILIGTIVMFMLGIFVVTLVILQQKQVIQYKLKLKDKDLLLQKEMLRAALQGQESERKRISEDLHDEVGAQLSVLKLNLNHLQQQAQDAQVDRIKETKEFTDTIIQQLRFISQSLHPQALENLGLSHALDSFCNLMNKNKTIAIHYKTDGNKYGVDKEKALNVYRVVQELINNILKHAEAQNITITYQASPQLLKITVEDDGNGRLAGILEASKQKQGSLGLKNIESRLNIIGGNINFAKNTTKGTIAEIQVANFQPTI